MNSRLNAAKSQLVEKMWSCVIMVEGKDPICSEALGIKPLMTELRKDKKAFAGGVIADRVVGKAAALMAILGGAKAVYGSIMSEAARQTLEKHHIEYEYGSLVPMIENRDRTGQCPMEQAVRSVDDPIEAFDVLEATIAKLMQAKN